MSKCFALIFRIRETQSGFYLWGKNRVPFRGLKNNRRGQQCPKVSVLFLQSPTPPQYVFWYHNQKMINYDTQRGGIAVDTEQGNPTTSKLTIQDASEADSGNYTCTSSNTQSASIYVFVSEGKPPIFLSFKGGITRDCFIPWMEQEKKYLGFSLWWSIFVDRAILRPKTLRPESWFLKKICQIFARIFMD